jgi:hypothetical protein
MKITVLKRVMLLLLLSLFASGVAFSEESSVANKAGEGIKKGGEAAGEGIKKGAAATEKGLKRGGEATVKGVKKAATWVGNKLDKALK